MGSLLKEKIKREKPDLRGAWKMACVFIVTDLLRCLHVLLIPTPMIRGSLAQTKRISPSSQVCNAKVKQLKYPRIRSCSVVCVSVVLPYFDTVTNQCKLSFELLQSVTVSTASGQVGTGDECMMR